ncbi:MAG TPA: DUF2232 domain-containing protein [Bdellovibrionales bacterium]|nr:DUF2232 domain-containing protein [Bdellovibrionales bacterium]
MIGLVALTALLVPLTGLFAAAPMRTLRASFSRLGYWLYMALVSAAFFGLGLGVYGLITLALAVLIGVFAEVEEHGGSAFAAGLAGILGSVGVTALAGSIWTNATRTNLMTPIRESAKAFVTRMAELNPQQGMMNIDDVMKHLPSVLIVALMIALAIALLWGPVLARLFAIPVEAESAPSRARLIDYRVPDLGIWIVIAALFGSFYRHGLGWAQVASLNVLNVMAIAYFFQGLAVITEAFRVFRVGPIWRAIWYTLIVLQLFLMVSVIGFVDFWLDFRTRLARRPIEPNKVIKN